MKPLRTDELIMLCIEERTPQGPQALTQRAIASSLSKDISNVSRLLRSLQADGYIDRFIYTNHENHRFDTMFYALTELGKKEIEVLQIRKRRGK